MPRQASTQTASGKKLHTPTAADSGDWDEVRAELGFTPEEEADIAERRARMLAAMRAHRLAEVRKDRGYTQKDLAAAIGVSQERVSQIERGSIEVAAMTTLAAYIAGLGGRLRVIADFGEEQILLG